MKKTFSLLTLCTALMMLVSNYAMAQSDESHTLEPLHVDGRYLKNPKGDIVTLHGWITNWQNMHQEFYQETVDYEAHFKAWKLTTDSILSKGWKVDYARLHFGYNNPRDFDGFVQRGEFEKTTLRMIDYLNSKGIYVLLMADVESGDLAEHPQRFVGDPLHQRLLRYWDYVSSHPRIKNNPGVMFELQNEPGNFMSSDGKLNDFRTLRAYYQPMVDLIRRNGCQQVIWVPGWHCQIYYAGYATFPIEGDNIGYAAHFYDWGWVDGEEVKRVWRELKAASNMAPVIITETYWDGQYGPFMGGTASGFGASLKRELDEAGNVSWNLLSEGHPMASVGDSSYGPAMHNDPEGTYVACHKWFEEYAKTKYTPIISLVATQIELEEVHKTVYPGDVRPITLMASFQDGRRWNVAGDTEWTSSNESVLTVIKGNIHVKGEGKVTVSGTYTDGMGQVFKTQFDVTSSLFPLTTDGIVIHNGGYDEITHTFSEGHYRWDYGGDVLLFVGMAYLNTPTLNWNQRGGLDFSAYKYLVVRMNNQTSFGTIELYDQLTTTYDGAAKVYEQIDGRNEVVIDLHGYPNFDPSHVTSVAIGSGMVSIKEIFLSNDGVNPAAPYTMPTLVTADDMTMYYGDVPQLTYSVSGYGNVGTPKLTTTATSTSPVGTYDILIEGDAEGVTYKPGKLTVLPAPLTITADDIVMNPGTDVPKLTLTYDGLKGSETVETALSELPTAATTATKDSSCGNYSITVSGGSAANYELAWHPGTLTIAPAAGSSVPVTDYTSRVKTDTESWQAWGECSTDFAPAVTTADGRTAPMVERYEETVETVGRIMEQTVSGLEDGEYTVVLCANANYTDGRGFASSLQDGARDVVELYANDERLPMTAHIGTAVGNNGEYTFNSVRVTDGTLTIGMEAIKPGTNWHTLQIKQLALNKVYTLAESYAVALAEAEELLSHKMADAARGVLQEMMGLKQSYANYYRLTEAIAQAKSSIEAMEYARIALDVTRDELLTATNVCTPQAKSDYLYYYNAACRAYDEDWLTDYKATEIYNPYKGGGADSYWYLVGYMMSAWEYNMGNTFYMGGAPYNVSWCDPMEAPDKMGFNKPFIEYLLTEGSTTLEARTLKATMTDMEPGLYTVTVRVRLRVADNENGKPEGVTLQVCDGAEVPLCGQRIDDSKDYQDTYTATGIVGDDGVLTIMFHVASDNNLCWMAFRDLWQDKGGTSIVTADNLTMVYGDGVPPLTYSLVGEELGGEPQLTTVVTSASPVGTYPITVGKGSVTRHAVEYVAGTLTVTKAPLTVTAKSYTVEHGKALPAFEVGYSGFKNGETAEVLIKKPVVNCEATSVSIPGTYEIVPSAATADNYDITYVKGTLTIAPAPYYWYVGKEVPTLDTYMALAEPISSLDEVPCPHVLAEGLFPCVIFVPNECRVELADGGGQHMSTLVDITSESNVPGYTCYKTQTAAAPGVSIYMAAYEKFITKEIQITPSEDITLVEEETVTFSAIPRSYANAVAYNQTVTWTTSDASVATIDANGLLTAISAGTAIITATANDSTGVSAIRMVTVEKKVIAVTNITLNKTTAALTEGETLQLTATVSPADATDKTVTWSSSKTSVATVDSNGKVTAVAAGTATITAQAGDKTATCVVTVEKKAPEITYANIADGDYYLKNVGSDLYLVGANSWGTQSSLGEYGVNVTLERLPNGKYTIDTHISNSETDHYMGSNGYMDAAQTEWIIAEPTSGTYALTLDGTNYWGYDGSSTVLSSGLTDATHKNAQWQLVTRADLEAALTQATLTNGVDATFYIQGHSFNRNHDENAAWMGEPVLGGPEGDMCGERWNVTPIDIYQEVSGLPNGYYTLEVQGFYRDHSDPNETAEHRNKGIEQLRASLYAGEYSVALKSILDGATSDLLDGGIQTRYGWVPNSMHEASSYFNHGCYKNKLDVWVSNGTLRIGIRKDTGDEGDWVIFDNFRLTYYGTEDPAGITPSTLDAHPTIIYDLLGRRVLTTDNLKGGIYIINGKKEIIK